MKLPFCECTNGPRKFQLAVLDLWEELIEFVEEPSWEEFSDICFASGRLVACICGKTYIRIPGDIMCLNKITQRYHESGCVRSLRHRPNGLCASKQV